MSGGAGGTHLEGAREFLDKELPSYFNDISIMTPGRGTPASRGASYNRRISKFFMGAIIGAINAQVDDAGFDDSHIADLVEGDFAKIDDTFSRSVHQTLQSQSFVETTDIAMPNVVPLAFPIDKKHPAFETMQASFEILAGVMDGVAERCRELRQNLVADMSAIDLSKLGNGNILMKHQSAHQSLLQNELAYDFAVAWYDYVLFRNIDRIAALAERMFDNKNELATIDHFENIITAVNRDKPLPSSYVDESEDGQSMEILAATAYDHLMLGDLIILCEWALHERNMLLFKSQIDGSIAKVPGLLEHVKICNALERLARLTLDVSAKSYSADMESSRSGRASAAPLPSPPRFFGRQTSKVYAEASISTVRMAVHQLGQLAEKYYMVFYKRSDDLTDDERGLLKETFFAEESRLKASDSLIEKNGLDISKAADMKKAFLLHSVIAYHQTLSLFDALKKGLHFINKDIVYVHNSTVGFYTKVRGLSLRKKMTYSASHTVAELKKLFAHEQIHNTYSRMLLREGDCADPARWWPFLIKTVYDFTMTDHALRYQAVAYARQSIDRLSAAYDALQKEYKSDDAVLRDLKRKAKSLADISGQIFGSPEASAPSVAPASPPKPLVRKPKKRKMHQEPKASAVDGAKNASLSTATPVFSLSPVTAPVSLPSPLLPPSLASASPSASPVMASPGITSLFGSLVTQSQEKEPEKAPEKAVVDKAPAAVPKWQPFNFG